MQRLEGRIDVWCETKKASAVAIHSGWQDLQAITQVFTSAMIGYDADFGRVMKPIQRFVDDQESQTADRVAGVSPTTLVRGQDYITP